MINLGSYIKVSMYTNKIKKEILYKILVSMLITTTYILQAILLAKGVSKVFNKESIASILTVFFLATCAMFFRAYLIWFNEAYTKKISAHVKAYIRNSIIEKMMKLGPQYQYVNRSGRLQSLITDGIEAIEPFLINYIPQMFIVVATVLFISTYVVILSSKIALILIISCILAVILPHMLQPIVKRATIGYWKSYSILNAQYTDTLQGICTLKAFNANKEKGKELYNDAYDFYKKSIKNTTFSLISSTIIFLCIGVGSWLTVGVGAIDMSKGLMLESQLLILLFLIPECIRPIFDLNGYWHQSYMGLSVAEQLFTILDEPEEILDIDEKNNTPNIGNTPNLELKNVGFKYNNKGRFGLNDVSIVIPSGKTIAVVGRSGSGKSTLVNLILRFYNLSTGKIMIDGEDITNYSLNYLRSKISVVFQDTFLFYGTIEENIHIARPDATKEEVRKAAKLSRVDDFVQNMDKGYDTMVGERGASLSGGERQRIAIARALLKDAPILILDEATSNIDAANEKLIQLALEDLKKNRTTLVIAHRLSTIINADEIMVMDEGEIVERGTHKELMKKDGIYSKLVKTQESGDINYE